MDYAKEGSASGRIFHFFATWHYKEKRHGVLLLRGFTLQKQTLFITPFWEIRNPAVFSFWIKHKHVSREVWTQGLLESSDTVIPASLLKSNLHLLLSALLASTARAHIRGRHDKKGFRVFTLSITVQIWSLEFSCWIPVRLSMAVAADMAHYRGVNKVFSGLRSSAWDIPCKNSWDQVETISSEQYDFVSGMGRWFGFIFIYFHCGLLWSFGFFCGF